MKLSLLSILATLSIVSAFVPQSKQRTSTACFEKNFFGKVGDSIGNFFTELDNFMDDASARRLGNGAKFYGKRKSNFYGEQDSMKKSDPNQADPTEDYQVTAGGYFMWKQDEDGQMRPVTRMKKQVVEKGDSYWERVFSNNGEKEKEEA